MVYPKEVYLLLIAVCCWNSCSLQTEPEVFYPPSDEIKKVTSKVFDWQKQHHYKADWGANWLNATLFHGVTVIGIEFGEEKYIEWAEEWANHNDWKIGKQKLHPDAQASGLTYLLLYEREEEKRAAMVADILLSADSLISFNREESPLWNWSDALYMGPPALIKAAELIDDEQIKEYVHMHFWEAYDLLYDTEHNLFYRDRNYINVKDQDNQPVFWSRGNGWVMGGLVTLLEFMPKDDQYYHEYLQLYKKMVNSIVKVQPDDGLWRTNLLNPSLFPEAETSGSAFFAYALAWGLNQKIISGYKYRQALLKAWRGLVSSVHSDGKLGWAQGIASKPGEVDPENSEIYSTGAFFLAASEVHKLVEK